MKLVGLAGPLCSGKTTVAEKLMDEGLVWMRAGFAMKLKDLASEIWGPEVLDKDFAGRTCLQMFGDLVKEIDEVCFGRVGKQNTWTQHVKMRILEAQRCGFEGVAIDDIRFTYEVDMIQDLGGIVIYLETAYGVQAERIQRRYGYTDEELRKITDHDSEKQHYDVSDMVNVWHVDNNCERDLKEIVEFVRRQKCCEDML